MASITVTATGTAPVEEHRAEVHLRLEAPAALPGEALTVLAAKVERLRGLLAARGVPDGDVVTQHLDVQPRWGERGVPDGSLAATDVRVAVGAPTQVGALLDHLLAGLGEGASVQHVAQVALVTDAHEAAARRAAVEAARERAQQLAEASGGTIGGLLSLLEGGPAPGWSPFPMARKASAAAEVHVWDRRSEAAVTVTAVYELVERA